MSCFIVKSETVSTLSDFLACLLNNGYNYFGFSAPESLHIELQNCRERGYYQERKIFQALSELNRYAYIGRYEEEAGYIPASEYKENAKHKPAEYGPMNPKDSFGGYTVQVQPWHYEMMNHIDCFLYQCMEEPAKRTDLFKSLEELQMIMAFFIARHNQTYTSHKWGE